MIEPIKYEKLFSTPFLRYQVNDHKRLSAQLLEEGEKLRDQDEGASKSNRGGWHSTGNIFEHDTPGIQQLRVIAARAVKQATIKIGAKADLKVLNLKLFGWMNANPKGGFNAPHAHPGAHWSGVYYVSQPEVEVGSSGKIEFIAPRADLAHWKLLDAPAFRLKRSLRPEAGELLLFPSYLTHWVFPNEADEERVTVAFNATFRKSKSR